MAIVFYRVGIESNIMQFAVFSQLKLDLVQFPGFMQFAVLLWWREADCRCAGRQCAETGCGSVRLR